MLWKGEKDSMAPSMLIGWSLMAPREVTSIQWGDGPQMNTCGGRGQSDRLRGGRPVNGELRPYPRVSRDVLEVSEPGDPPFGGGALLRGPALCLLVLFELQLLFSEVDVVGHLRWGGSRVKTRFIPTPCSPSSPDLTFLKRTFRLFCGCCWSYGNAS